MKIFRKRLFRLGNKGLSMVELICGIAILSFIGTAISGVMVISADSYKRGSAEAEVQKEAQLVANQINDLMIDATDDVTYSGNVLEITQSDGTVHKVTWNSAQQKLYYEEIVGGVSSPQQLLATGITSFSPNVSDYLNTGYATLEMDVVSGSRTYPAKYTITGRNKDMHGSSIVAASIDVVPEWLMEPNESHTFTATVSGISNTAVDWTLTGDTPGGGTTLAADGTLTIGANETSNRIYLTAATNEVDASNVPLAQKTITVYIRRVNNISLTGTHVDGVEKKAGAKYDMSTLIEGSMLLQLPGAYDTNYVDPYQVNLSLMPSHVGHFEGHTLVLDQDIAAGTSITVTAKALHPNGGTYNKSNLPYGTVEDSWTLISSYVSSNPDANLERGSDVEQGNFTGYDMLKQELINTLGNGNYEQRDEYRFRAVDDAGNPIESWFGWHPDPEDFGYSINIRPRVSLCMEYLLPYEVEVRTSIWKDGVQVWPLASHNLPASAYTIIGVMKKVQVTFDSTAFGLTETIGGASANKIPVNDGSAQELLRFKEGIAIKDDVIQSNIRYKVEKEVQPGVWMAAEPSEIEIAQQGVICSAKVKSAARGGKYRILVWLEQVQLNQYVNDATYDQTGRVDVLLYDTNTSEGVFYFEVE